MYIVLRSGKVLEFPGLGEETVEEVSKVIKNAEEWVMLHDRFSDNLYSMVRVEDISSVGVKNTSKVRGLTE